MSESLAHRRQNAANIYLPDYLCFIYTRSELCAIAEMPTQFVRM